MSTVRQRGESWQAIVRVKLKGQEYHESRTFRTERLAKEWASRLEATIKLHGIPQRVATSKTLGDLLLDYQRDSHKVKPMRRQMAWELEQLANEFKSVRLSDLSSKHINDFGTKRRLEGTGPSTILHNLSTLRGVLNAAKPMYGLNINGDCVTEAVGSLARMGAVSRSRTRSRRPSPAELAALDAEFNRIANHPSTVIPMATFIKLAVSLPRRREELLTMRWVDYTGTELTLHDTKHPTTPRTEIIPVPPEAAAIIDSLPRIDERILPYNPESVSASFERACNRLRIEDLRLHDLRHEGITRLFESGLSIPEVSLISGHKSWAMLRRYTHITPQDVLEKLSAGRKKTQKDSAEPERP